MSTTGTHPIFTPTDLDPERLDDITVGRVDLISRLTARVRSIAGTQARPHSLVIGPRGSGKTHLFSVVLHRATRDPLVAGALQIIRIPEDAIGLRSYNDLLVEFVRQARPAELGSARALRVARETVALERLVLTIAENRTTLLVLENLDRVFSAIGESGQRSLRGWIETSAQVAILATTPVLFHGIASRSEPFYGSFDVDHLTDLTLAEGTELLRKSAAERGDADLATFLDTDLAQGRLAALAHLAGGSPRLWQLLAAIVTIGSLNDLIPAVRALLDKLTPYYQQRLWELSDTEQGLVVELARGSGALTAAEIADLAAISRATANTLLGRLEQAGWVRRAKLPGTDQRRTWYEIREPLLRHFLDYRESAGGPLDLIVQFLQSWYSPLQRWEFLADAGAMSTVQVHLAQALLRDPPRRSDGGYADRDVRSLLATSRLWRHHTGPERSTFGSPALGAAIEDLCIRVLAQQEIPLVESASRSNPVDQIGLELEALTSRTWSDHDYAVLEVTAACWNGSTDPASARDRLTSLVSQANDVLFRFQIGTEVAFFQGEAGDSPGARAALKRLVAEGTELFGAEHPDVLVARSGEAFRTGETGHHAIARDLYATLITDRTRTLGPDHPDTLNARHGHAYETGETGDRVTARDLYATLITDLSRTPSPTSSELLRATAREWATLVRETHTPFGSLLKAAGACLRRRRRALRAADDPR